jgi:5-methyltetrahydropteroyltriglutamate--homocysteine methyltransferase
MKHSTERILTTHVGSLARPAALLDVMAVKERHEPYDVAAYAELVRQAVADVVRRQAACGLDIVADGEQGKVTFATYVKERLSGFEEGEGKAVRAASWAREAAAFPGYYEDYFGKYSASVSPLRPLVCRGPVSYIGQAAVQADIANLRAALDSVSVTEAFMPATIPVDLGENQFYANADDYREAVTEALREEYRAILDAGLLLQIDDPTLIEIMNEDPARDLAVRRREAAQHVEQLNHALRGFPADRIRLHVCYGLNHGPRIHDAPLREVVDFMLEVNAGAYSFEVANPRHMHEWRVWEEVRLPEGKLLIPGFLSHGMSFIEHPQLIADQIETYARLVGRENVIAGADCGFSSRASYKPEVHPSVVWAKFEALAEGARLATRRLWGAARD